MKKLFIVESPGKVKTIQNFLGPDYVIVASIGHCYQIEPKDGAIDIDNGYKPHYIPVPKKEAVIANLKKLSREHKEVIIATDDDREGAAIGYHIAKFALDKKCEVKRIRFQEITKSAILAALKSPTQINMDLYYAQQARSVLDMLVGFKVSPILWRKVCNGTSAGRVQSIGLMLIVERQKEIDKFVSEEYWDITGWFLTKKDEELKATYKSNEKLTTEDQVTSIIDSISKVIGWSVKSISKSRKNRAPQPVFNTSSLQQFCSACFNWDGKKTMKLAQDLYEGFSINGRDSTGLITYHRTDSVNISVDAIANVRDFIKTSFGDKYLPGQLIVYKSKNKNAQEAHEGIRPSHLEIPLNEIRASIDEDQYKLYEAIFNKFVSCQMTDAVFDVTKIEIISNDNKHLFTANGQTLVFDGFLKCWPYSTTKEEILPLVVENENVKLKDVKGEQHFTKPPAMYNTASVVKKLEEEGIGRPSTYATIIDTLLKRQYIEKQGKAFIPTDLGKKVCDYLMKAFPELMNMNFTARIEDQLDDVADATKVWYNVVDSFFIELKKRLSAARDSESMKSKDVTDITCPTCGKFKLVKRFSRFGSFYGCDGFRDKENKCSATFKIGPDGEPIVKEVKEKRYLEGVTCDRCGSKIVIRTGHKSGKEFCGCESFPKCRRMFNMNGEPFEFKSKKDKYKKTKKSDESN